MKMMRFVAPLSVAVALGLAACGGDDSSSSDDFIADADAICSDASQQLADAALALDAPPAGAGDVASLYEAQDPPLADAQARLEQLDAPAELSDDWDRYLALNQERIDARERAVAGKDDKQINAAVEDQFAALEKRDEVGAEIGLGACADVLSDADQQAVTDREQEFASAEDPETICNEIFLPQYVQYLWGGDVQGCVKDPVTAKPIEIDISEISGVDGVRAQVELELTAGQPSLVGHKITDEWYFVDGDWRLYNSIIE